MLSVTATEFKSNLGKYLSLVNSEEIRITKNGADIAVLTAPERKRDWVDDITGIISPDPVYDDLKKFKADRLWEKYESIS